MVFRGFKQPSCLLNHFVSLSVCPTYPFCTNLQNKPLQTENRNESEFLEQPNPNTYKIQEKVRHEFFKFKSGPGFSWRSDPFFSRGSDPDSFPSYARMVGWPQYSLEFRRIYVTVLWNFSLLLATWCILSRKSPILWF